MNLCLSLAKQGIGYVHPNPMVGCVIVCEDIIIGQGYHEAYGKAHAEVNAIHAVSEKELLPDSTLYVNLEPCSHYGKTPPCADLIIKSGIKRVVIGSVDPFKEVAGKGIEKLEAAGIAVISGISEEACFKLNEHFLTSHQKQRPFITIKYAQSLDGCIATGNQVSKWLSGLESRTYTHTLRSWHCGIMIGTHTALRDNPMLTVRHVKGRHPVRILLDRQLEVPLDFNLFNQDAPTFLFTSSHNKDHEKLNAYNKPNLRLFFCKDEKDGLNLNEVLRILYQENITSVLVEGGSQLISGLMQHQLCDKFSVFITPKFLGSDSISVIRSLQLASPSEAPMLNFESVERFGPDIYVEGHFLHT